MAAPHPPRWAQSRVTATADGIAALDGVQQRRVVPFAFPGYVTPGKASKNSMSRDFAYASRTVRRLVIASATMVLSVALVVSATRHPANPWHTRAEVLGAFRDQGFDLRNWPREVDGRVLYSEDAWILGPWGSSEFTVYVLPTRFDARQLAASYTRLGPPRFAVLQGNVYVQSIDPAFSRAERKRVRSAMLALAGFDGSST